MNLKTLKLAEERFMQRYPGGFSHPEIQAIGKKHRFDQMVALAQDEFAKSRFRNPESVADAMVKTVSRSSLISIFEKPRFRDAVRTMAHSEKDILATGLEDFLHGRQQRGFEAMTMTLAQWKLAKWSLLTVIPNYYRPNDEVFVKPTTAKGVIEYFELQNLAYSAKPSWDFYRRFHDEILKMKASVDDSLAPSNAAFLGFLMMSFKSQIDFR
ncbi:MAG: hypothetical protein WAO76_13200 [Georgfuchsia sp.]